MSVYKFRTNTNTPQGAIHPVGLEHRVLASLKDAAVAGFEARFDWLSAEIGNDGAGDYVVLSIDWPNGMSFGDARPYIDRHFVTIE
jgi:hypothetical protein